MPQEHPIRKARHARQLSQEQLGGAVGVTKATVCQWEKGTKLPVPATAIRLGRVLGLSLDQIYADAAQQEAA